MTTWILVSDASRAQLLAAELPEDDWTLVASFQHPAAREMAREIRPSSPPGRMQQTGGEGSRRTALEPRSTPKEIEGERFAGELADYLESAHASRRYDGVVLVAPPHFLGMLQRSLGVQTRKHILATWDKDFSMFPPAELRKRLFDVVFPPSAAPED